MSKTRTPLQQRLGLKRTPFPAAPDVGGYIASDALEADRMEAAHVLRSRAGFVLVSGEVGTGKTTFLRRLIADVQGDGMAISLVFNTFLQGGDLLAAVLRDFGLAPSASPAGDIETLNRFLIQRWKQGTACVLVIDDAQNLEPASLELVRLLTNLETGQEKLLQIVLCGQPELCTRLADHSLRQLTSRIVKHVQLSALPRRHICGYVHARLDAAGAQGRLRLGTGAAPLLHLLSGGNPRRIHLIMDRALYGLKADAQAIQHIHAGLVLRAASESGAGLSQRPRPLAWAAAIALALATGSLIGLLDSQPAQATQTPSVAMSADKPSAEPADTTLCSALAGYRGPHVVPQRFASLPGNTPRCLQQEGAQWLGWWPSPATALDMRRVQEILHQQGQYDGRIDGAAGPLTERALRRLQQLWELPPTGHIDPATAHLLHSLAKTPSLSSPQLETAAHGHG